MGKRKETIGFLSLSSSFLVFEFFSSLLLKALELLNATTKRTKEGGERESFALSLCREHPKISLKISHKGAKKKKKRKKIFSLCAPCSQGGRASSLRRRRRRHHQPSLWNTEQREKKESREEREDAKNPDIWWREEVLLGVLLIERSVFARAFVPL